MVLKSSPDWMRYMVYFLFAYAAVNFLLYMTTVGFGHAGDPTAQDWRGFSGHWMVFYSASLAILYSAARGMANVPRCLNGHPGTPGLSTATAADSR